MVFDCLADAPRPRSCRNMSGNGSKDVAAMKRPAHLRSEELRVRDLTRLVRHVAVDHRKQSVVRTDESMAFHLNQDWTASSPDSGIDHPDVNRALREVSPRLGQQKR